MKYFLIFLLSFFLLPLATTPVFAKISINEFSSYSTDDWIELYNDSDNDVDLSAYRLRDSTATNKIDLTGKIASHGFYSIDWYNKLNKDGDSIRLLLIADENTVEDQITYGTPDIPGPYTSTQTVGRKTDGGGEWVIFDQPTKGSSNNNALAASLPTSTPADTPTTAKTPTPTKIPTPTRTPTPKKTPTPVKTQVTSTSTKAQSVLAAKTTNNLSVLHEDAMDNAASTGARHPTATLLTTEKKKAAIKQEILGDTQDKQNPFVGIAIAGGVLCLSACGILVYLYYKKQRV